jgi:M6 family metalloprotease-like protein
VVVALTALGCGGPEHDPPEPIDPQRVQDQDEMTWDDYRPLPGIDWADPSLTPERRFRIALVAVDFSDQPFVITLPRGSDPFGNPQIDPVPRDSVPAFYRDFWIDPSPLNHGQTINGYWMEQSRGAFGITDIDAYGPYRMPRPLWTYGLSEWGQNEATPDGTRVDRLMEPDVDSLWRADAGDVAERYDAVLRIYAGYDETSVWQEFGEMKFATREDIPPEWGNPNPEMPRWVPTRYVEWTSWLAGAQQWGRSSMRQGESSGTITHELGHFAFGIPDLNNNPYVEPYRRVAAGPWDMMDRGSFNGPGGPHSRWVVPPTQGASMPAGLMLRNRLENDFVTWDDVLELSREALAETGMVVARITARAVEPVPGAYAGVVVRLDGADPGDRATPSDPAADPLSPGLTPYDFYSLEVVQRVGYDSFTPDDGVLLAKNRDELRGSNGGPNAFNGFIRVVDAHPEDISEVDYVRPGGEPVMRTIADYRQLNDALFHAGLDSGSSFEHVDEANRLHFYVVDLERDARGIRTYTLGLRSLDGAGDWTHGVALTGPSDGRPVTPHTPFALTITNTGERPTGPAIDGEAGSATAPDARATHPDDIRGHDDFDVFRISVSVDGRGWSAQLLNALAAVRAGDTSDLTVRVTPAGDAQREARVTVRAASESDPTKIAEAVWTVRR